MGEFFGTAVPGEIVVQQMRVLKFDHRSARTGGRNDGLPTGERGDGGPGQLTRAIVVPAVEVRLPATGLRLRKSDLDTEAAQQAHRGYPDVGEEHVAQAGNHQCDSHTPPS